MPEPKFPVGTRVTVPVGPIVPPKKDEPPAERPRAAGKVVATDGHAALPYHVQLDPEPPAKVGPVLSYAESEIEPAEPTPVEPV